MLVHVLVGDDLALQLRGAEMPHVAANAVLRGELDHRVGQHPFDARALDLAGGEGVPFDHGRRLGEDDFDAMGANLVNGPAAGPA